MELKALKEKKQKLIIQIVQHRSELENLSNAFNDREKHEYAGIKLP